VENRFAVKVIVWQTFRILTLKNGLIIILRLHLFDQKYSKNINLAKKFLIIINVENSCIAYRHIFFDQYI